MSDNKSAEYKDFIKSIGKIDKQIRQLNQQRFAIIEPELRNAMKNGNQDLRYLESLIDILLDMQYSSCLGEQLLMEAIEYLKPFAPESAEFYAKELAEMKECE